MMLTTGQSNQKAEKAANQGRRLRARTLVWNENNKTLHSAKDCHCRDCVRQAGAFDKERGQHAVQKSDISPDDGIVTVLPSVEKQ